MFKIKKTLKKISLFGMSLLVSTSIMPSKALMANAVVDGPNVYLNFDGNANDTSGNLNNGTVFGSPTYLEGKTGNAIKFNTYTDYVTFGNNANLNFGADTDFTIGFWIKGSWTDSDPAIISNKDWSSGSNTGWQIGIYNNMLQWNYKGATGPRKDMKDLFLLLTVREQLILGFLS